MSRCLSRLFVLMLIAGSETTLFSQILQSIIKNLAFDFYIVIIRFELAIFSRNEIDTCLKTLGLGSWLSKHFPNYIFRRDYNPFSYKNVI